MSKTLLVYYYPDHETMVEAHSSNADVRYNAWQKVRVYSQNGRYDKALDRWHNFIGNFRELVAEIHSLTAPSNFDDCSGEEEEDGKWIDLESVSALSAILAECPWKGGYITIKNQ
jgi:hypothetical protein